MHERLLQIQSYGQLYVLIYDVVPMPAGRLSSRVVIAKKKDLPAKKARRTP
jgi:hypothetical protein